MITLSKALTLCLRDRALAVVTDYSLFLLIHELFTRRAYEGEQINIKLAQPKLGHLNRTRDALLAISVLTRDNDLADMAYRVLIVPDEPAEHIVCETDPLAYISHLSAMQHHGLTNRNPVDLSMTRPNRTDWRRMLAEELARTLGTEHLASDHRQLLQRPLFPKRIRGRKLAMHEMTEVGAWLAVRGSPLRVATVGQTFLDTISHPKWCGGMAHVLEMWEEHAPTFLEEIIEAVEKTQRKIVKVRAGYILEEWLGISDPRIKTWARFAQRGGSQVLDPSNPYTTGLTPKFSENWMISINV